MTKKEIIEEIARKTDNGNKKDIKAVVETFMDTVRGSVESGNKVYLRKFGTFRPKKRKQKKARIISENKEIIIPDHYIPDFKPAAEFKESVKDKVR
jgi:DNA-binding protein HU-beta